jgi:hypothetical protein
MEHEQGGSQHGLFTVFCCDEHGRELAKGVPVGHNGLARNDLGPKGSSVPQPGAGISAFD